jgi:hypothetical protein
MLNLSKDSDDLLYTVSLLHGFYGCYTAELSLKSVQFYGPGSEGINPALRKDFRSRFARSFSESAPIFMERDISVITMVFIHHPE